MLSIFCSYAKLKEMYADSRLFHCVLRAIFFLFIPIVKYTVKVYTPDSHARVDYILTVKIKGQGEQKTTDHVFYETTQDTERFDICSFLCPSYLGSRRTCKVTKMLLKPFRGDMDAFRKFPEGFPGFGT